MMGKILTEYLFDDAFVLFHYHDVDDCDVSFLDPFLELHGCIIQSRTYFKDFEVIS